MDRFKRPLIYLGLVLVLALTIFLIAGCGDDSQEKSAAEGKDMTEFSTETLTGEKVDQTIFENSDVTMVNFWATYCGPCIDEMPDLGKIYRERGSDEFNIVGIVTDVQNSDFSVMDDKVAEADLIIEQTKADYQHLLVSKEIAINMMDAYEITSIPTTFFVDNQGRVIDGPYIGSRSKSDWEKIIDGIEK